MMGGTFLLGRESASRSNVFSGGTFRLDVGLSGGDFPGLHADAEFNPDGEYRLGPLSGHWAQSGNIVAVTDLRDSKGSISKWTSQRIRGVLADDHYEILLDGSLVYLTASGGPHEPAPIFVKVK